MPPKSNRVLRIALAATGLGLSTGIIGGSCTGLTVDLPLPGGGSVQFNTVTVELWNTTAYPIEPRLFVDPEDDSFNVDADENRVVVSPAISPGEVVTLTMACSATGAIETDHAVMLLPLFEDVESDNDPIARRHDDFNCGDTVSFIFIDDPGDDFHTRVEVNGEFLED